MVQRGKVRLVHSLGPLFRLGSRLYIHASYWPGTWFSFYGLENRIVGAQILGSPASKIRIEQNGLRVTVKGLPRRSPDPSCTVIELELDGPPRKAGSAISLWTAGAELDAFAAWSEEAGIHGPGGILSEA